MKQAEERFTSQKRQEFLALVRNGLRAWRHQNARKRIERIDEGNNESLGTQLGRRVRYALEYARRQEELRKNHPRREEEGESIRHPATDIINVLNPLNHAAWFYSRLNPAERKDSLKSLRKRKKNGKNKMLRQRQTRAGDGKSSPTFYKKGKVMDDEKKV